MATRISPHTVTDDVGEYIVFPGKHCSAEGCGLALTSRNRSDHRLLCREHGRARGRAMPSRAKQAPRDPREFAHVTDPQRLKVHHALGLWLIDPCSQHFIDGLKSAMVDFELRYRFARHDLPPPRAYMPVEEPTFSNPQHRTTHGEFITDCRAHGA